MLDLIGEFSVFFLLYYDFRSLCWYFPSFVILVTYIAAFQFLCQSLSPMYIFCFTMQGSTSKITMYVIRGNKLYYTTILHVLWYIIDFYTTFHVRRGLFKHYVITLGWWSKAPTIRRSQKEVPHRGAGKIFRVIFTIDYM